MEYRLRNAASEDKPLVKQINDACYRSVVIDQFGEWDIALQREFFEKKWSPSKYQIIEQGGHPVGVLSLEKGVKDWFLSEIQITPEHQGAGVGTAIIEDLLTEADQTSIVVKLQVLKKNRAVSLYDRFGFVHTGETETHFFMERPPN